MAVAEHLEYRVPNQRRGADGWRVITRPEFGLSVVISDVIASSKAVSEKNIRPLRKAAWLFIFSDYGGAHKGARYEVYSYLVTTLAGISNFDARRQRLRQASLGSERRMAYKALNDKIRLRSLPGYLENADLISGILISFAVDKRAFHRLTESPKSDTAFGSLGPWAAKSFGKLSRVGHLAAIIVEGLRADGQSLLWITDEDEIAPNLGKHTEATKFLGHIISHYCTGDMGHFRFGTTASDSGDLLIEDLAAIPDLAAGTLNEVISRPGLQPDSRWPQGVVVVDDGKAPVKVQCIASWLSGSYGNLKKINVVIDEGSDGCWVRRFSVEAQPGHRLGLLI